MQVASFETTSCGPIKMHSVIMYFQVFIPVAESCRTAIDDAKPPVLVTMAAVSVRIVAESQS